MLLYDHSQLCSFDVLAVWSRLMIIIIVTYHFLSPCFSDGIQKIRPIHCSPHFHGNSASRHFFARQFPLLSCPGIKIHSWILPALTSSSTPAIALQSSCTQLSWGCSLSRRGRVFLRQFEILARPFPRLLLWYLLSYYLKSRQNPRCIFLTIISPTFAIHANELRKCRTTFQPV